MVPTTAPALLRGATCALLLAACGSEPAAVDTAADPANVAGDAGTAGDFDGVGAADAGSDAALPDIAPSVDTGGTGSDAGRDTAGDARPDDVAPPIDTGTGSTDTGTTDTGTTGIDTGGPDATGELCTPGSTRCTGNTLVTCGPDGASVGRVRCENAGQRCGLGPDGIAACLAPECTPGSTFCVDANNLASCDGDGAIASVTPCEAGCDSATGSCVVPFDALACDPDGVEPIGVGTDLTVDLGAATDDADNIAGDVDCRDFRSRGEERVYALTVTARRTIQIDLRDDDPNAAIDTLLYIRSTCDDPDTQLQCRDDLSCGESDIDTDCTADTDPQTRHSRLSLELDPGTYFVFAEHFNYSDATWDYTCGQVRLTVTAP